MPLADAILGVLVDAPAHGYSLKKDLEGRFARQLGINDGQLYPTLRRLEREGLIRKEVVEQRSSPTKHLYRVTDAGRAVFRKWLEGLDAREGGDCGPRLDFLWRYDFLQRCMFFHQLEPDQIRRQVRDGLQDVDRSLEELRAALDELAERGADAYRQMVVEYGIRYQTMRREWLLELLARSDVGPADTHERAAASGA